MEGLEAQVGRGKGRREGGGSKWRRKGCREKRDGRLGKNKTKQNITKNIGLPKT